MSRVQDGVRMDDNPESSCSSESSCSYQEYWKEQYNEVLESNSQMVLRLEEAKSMLFKTTRELQSQNSALMSENMNLRAQKEYLQQEFGKLGSLVGNLMEETGTQRGSMDRQKGYLDELFGLVKSVAENKDNNLTNPETETNTQEENAPFLNLMALRELDKQLRASTVGSSYLPAIEEENSPNDEDESSNATRPTRQPESTEQSHEVQGNSKSKERTVSKIGRRGPTIRMKKVAAKNKEMPQEENKKGGESAQRTADKPAEIIKNTSDEENEQQQATAIMRKSNYSMMANMEPSTSMLMERKECNHDGALALKEKRDDRISKSRASETISSNSKDIDHRIPNIQKDHLPEANGPPVFAQDMDEPQQTQNATTMKTLVTSYPGGGAQDKIRAERYHKSRPGKITSTESSKQIETKFQDKQIVEKMEKSVCQVELVDLLGTSQPNHLQDVNIIPNKQTKAIDLHQNMKNTSTTRDSEVLKLVEGRDQSGRENPTNKSRSSAKGFTAQSSANCTTEDAAMKILPNCQAKYALETKEIQTSSSKNTARVSEMSQAEQTKEPSNRSNKTPAETSHSEKKKSKPGKNQIIQSDASTTRSSKSLKFEECRNQPREEKLASGRRSSTNMSEGETSACHITEGAEMKISPNCEDIKVNDAPTLREALSSSLITAHLSELSQSREPAEPAETTSSGKKECKPKKRCGQSQELGECRDQPEREKTANGSQSSTNKSTAKLGTYCMTKDAMMKTTPNCEDTELNAVPRIRDFKSSNEIKGSDILQPQELNDPLDELNNIPAESSSLVNKENKPRKTKNISDGNATENTTQQALLPLARKSKYAKTKNSSTHSNIFTPVRDPSAAKDAPESDVSLNLAITPDENDSETRSASGKTFGPSKPRSPSMEDPRMSTRRTLRESQMANSLLGEVRISMASSQGESCFSDFATPKKVKVNYNTRQRQREFKSLLAESEDFQGEVRMTRARSKTRRDKDKKVIYNFSSTSETDEPNKDFEFKPPSRRPRRGAKK